MNRGTLVLGAVALLAAVSCSSDPAEREYLAALRGEEEGMSRQEQLAHIERAIVLRPRRASYWETKPSVRSMSRCGAGRS